MRAEAAYGLGRLGTPAARPRHALEPTPGRRLSRYLIPSTRSRRASSIATSLRATAAADSPLPAAGCETKSRKALPRLDLDVQARRHGLGGAATDEPSVGSADIQSLADLGNSFEVVRAMRVAPVTRDAILQLAAATLLPVAPLLLTVMPLQELLQKLLGVLFWREFAALLFRAGLARVAPVQHRCLDGDRSG